LVARPPDAQERPGRSLAPCCRTCRARPPLARGGTDESRHAKGPGGLEAKALPVEHAAATRTGCSPQGSPPAATRPSHGRLLVL
jgi:hypothetical protein